MINRNITFNTSYDQKIKAQQVYTRETTVNKSYCAYIKAQGGIVREIVFNISNKQFGDI